jgi:hypothetical protein
MLTKSNSVPNLALRITWETCVIVFMGLLADHRQWGRLDELLSFVKIQLFSTNLVVWGGAADFYALFVTLKRAIVENTFLETGERTFPPPPRIELRNRSRQFSSLRMVPPVASAE